MNTATVTVAFVNPPKGTAKKGTIKGKDGAIYGVWADKLNQFQPGKTYQIEYETSEYQGKNYTTVKKWTEAQAQQSAPAANGNGGGNGHSNPAKDEMIFVCGALNNVLSAGQIKPSQVEMTAFVNAARATWRETFGAGHDDGVPY